MTPITGIYNPIFQLYLIIASGVLAFAGLVLALFGQVLRRDVSKIWLTYRSWLIMVPLIVLSVAIGRWGVIVGCCLVSLAGFHEFARATELNRDWRICGMVYLLIVALAAISLGRRFELLMAAPVGALIILLALPILEDRTQGQLHRVAVAFLGFVWIGWMLAHLGYLANSQNPYGYLLFILFAAEINDVSAFTFGRLLGRRRLRRSISPSKTFAGAIGAIAVSMALPWIMRFSLPQLSSGQLIATGLIVGVGGLGGDLAMSLIKRDLSIKDMGQAIPGHGGVLDRIDSLLFIAPLFVQMLSVSRQL